MPNSHENQIRGLDFTREYRGRVVRNDDPMMEGRLGVFIPTLITEYPQGLEVPTPSVDVIPANLFANQRELHMRLEVKRDNYVWFRPGSQLIENGSKAKNHGGSWWIPRVGTMVTVYFENGDPNNRYWRSGSPSVKGDVISGKNLGKGTNLAETGANWTDPAKKVEIRVVSEHDNGNVIYLDNNESVNSFVIRWDNGHTLSIQHADASSGIVLETGLGHIFQMDDKSGQITMKTQSGTASITLDDKAGTVTIHAASGIVLDAPVTSATGTLEDAGGNTNHHTH